MVVTFAICEIERDVEPIVDPLNLFQAGRQEAGPQFVVLRVARVQLGVLVQLVDAAQLPGLDAEAPP